MAKRRTPFDEDRSRPGIQAMPNTANRAGAKAKPGYTVKDLMYQRELEQNLARREAEAYSGNGRANPFSFGLLQLSQRRMVNLERQKRGQAPIDLKTGEVVKKAAPQTAAAAPAPVAAAVDTPAPAAPVAEASPVTAAPIAVTDPASQISPEEQAARLRARLLLSQGSNKLGRMLGLSSSQLGYRMLTGGGG